MMTSIAISKELKEKIRNLGRTGDSYEDVIQRMYDFTKGHLLLQYLYDESDSIAVADALKEAEELWPESS